jgi:hypothetical protein
MKNSESTPPARSYLGHVRNGIIVLDTDVPLQDGQAVRVEPLASGADTPIDAERAERVRRLQQLFTAWTEEDAQLTDEEADRLRNALEQDRGLRLGSPARFGSI